MDLKPSELMQIEVSVAYSCIIIYCCTYRNCRYYAKNKQMYVFVIVL